MYTLNDVYTHSFDAYGRTLLVGFQLMRQSFSVAVAFAAAAAAAARSYRRSLIRS